MDEQQNALVALGAYLTGTEAEVIASRLGDGDTLSQALESVQESRVRRVRELLQSSGYGTDNEEQLRRTISGLRGIQGAHADVKGISAVWTAPEGLTYLGGLNSSRSRLIDEAQSSIMCSTFNFQRSSALWKALKKAVRRPEIQVTIYVDTMANDELSSNRNSPTTQEIAREMPGAKVFRTVCDGDGHYYRNHAKFLSIDHRILLVTSANFSYSAEEFNIELGLQINDCDVAGSVERQMRRFERLLYERVN